MYVGAAGVVAVLAGACAAGGVPAGQMKLDIENATTLEVALVVNGVTVRAIAPGDAAEFEAGQLPSMPWNAEARTPSGRRLLGLHVNEGDVWVRDDENHGVAARVDLSCGRLDLWSGPPLAGPMPGPGSPGDCGP